MREQDNKKEIQEGSTTNTPQKSINVVIEDTKASLKQIITGSGLPVSIAELIISEILTDVSQAKVKIVETERQQYMDALANITK
jgi:hypothetical protein